MRILYHSLNNITFTTLHHKYKNKYTNLLIGCVELIIQHKFETGKHRNFFSIDSRVGIYTHTMSSIATTRRLMTHQFHSTSRFSHISSNTSKHKRFPFLSFIHFNDRNQFECIFSNMGGSSEMSKFPNFTQILL